MILTCEGEVFFATHSIENYLGFHQVGSSLDFIYNFQQSKEFYQKKNLLN